MDFKTVVAPLAFSLFAVSAAFAEGYSVTADESEAILASINQHELVSLRVNPVNVYGYGGNEYAWADKVLDQGGELRIAIEGCQLQIGSTLEILGTIPDPAWPERMHSVVVRYQESDIYEEGVENFTCGESEVLIVDMIYFPRLIEAAQRHVLAESNLIPQIKKILEQ